MTGLTIRGADINYKGFLTTGFFKDYKSTTSWYDDGTTGKYTFGSIQLDTSLQSSYHSNYNESRPKTKFFSLMIYAGYPA